jgi:hypothetical protein
LPSIIWVTDIWTYIELVPTYDTYPENEQLVYVVIGWKKSISSIAAVTIKNGNYYNY